MDNQVLAERRTRLMDRFHDGLVVIRGGGSDGINPSFVYLTGLYEADSALVLAADGVRIGTGRKNPGPDYVLGRQARQVLFLPRADALAAQWGEDSAVTADSADPAGLGVDAVLATADLNETLGSWLQSVSAVRIVRGHPASLTGAEDDDDTAYTDRIRRRYPGVKLTDGTPFVHEMRRIKDVNEQTAIERSVDVTRQALDALVARLGPGLCESELEAELIRVYRSHGGFHAFEPIVGCGPNALKLHYGANNGSVEAGKLLLVDTGVSIGGYKSDITRTLPVDGEFTDRQREVYETVLLAQQEAIEMCRPGALIGEIHARSFEVIAQAGFGGRDYPHGIGHHLGLETHDVGDVHLPLEAGAVVTIEPGLYLADEQIGIRIEDDVLVTESGPRVLSESIPKSAEAVERWISGSRGA
jgi:Xaa-Pro aminopeptidase